MFLFWGPPRSLSPPSLDFFIPFKSQEKKHLHELFFLFPVLHCPQLISADLTNKSNFQEVATFQTFFSLGQGSNWT